MSIITHASKAGSFLSAAAAMFALGCDEGFAAPSKVETLRVLGLQKNNPYAAPGEDVSLSLLWHDPYGRTLTPKWFQICVDPPGDLYHRCFAETFAAGVQMVGDVFTFTVPDDVVTRRAPPTPGQPSYGLMYAFFALCAGELTIEAPPVAGALPLVCRDEKGDMLGADDYVVGYSSIFVFPRREPDSGVFRNANPVIDGFRVAGTSVGNFCTGASAAEDEPAAGATPCLGPAGQAALEPDVDCQTSACVPACKDDGDSTCPAIPIEPIIERSSAEPDEVSRAYYGSDVTEEMWIDYYVDGGSVKSPVRLLNDATAGWNYDYSTSFYAPMRTGPVTVWAVVHDNRGGSNWVRTQIGVR